METEPATLPGTPGAQDGFGELAHRAAPAARRAHQVRAREHFGMGESFPLVFAAGWIVCRRGSKIRFSTRN